MKFEHYYICSICAIEKGLRWSEGHCATAHQDVCPYCGKIETLTSVRDWLKPNEEKMPLWRWD